MDTQRYIAQSHGAKLVILENNQIRCCDLEIRSEWLVGRQDPTRTNIMPDIPFASMIVSREHGWIRNIDGQWFYTDNAENLNGTFYNGKKIKKTGEKKGNSVKLSDGDFCMLC